MISKFLTLILASTLLAGCMVQPDGTLMVGVLPASTQKTVRSKVVDERNQDPVILSFTANPTNQTRAGGIITFNLDFVDRDGDTIKASWAATGGTLSSTSGRIINWVPPKEAGVYIVSVGLNDGKGGASEGALNVIVNADGTAQVSASPVVVTPKEPVPDTEGPTVTGNVGRFTQVPLNLRIAEISAISPDRVAVAGEDKIAITVNAGLNWNIKSFKGQQVTSVDFIDQNRGWAIVGGAVFQTTDGGGNWKPLAIKIGGVSQTASPGFKTVDFINESQGAAHRVTEAFVTNDGGRSWTPVFDAQNALNGLLSFEFAADGTLYLGGSPSRIIKVNGNQFGTVPGHDDAELVQVGSAGKGLALLNGGSLVRVSNFGQEFSDPVVAETETAGGTPKVDGFWTDKNANVAIARLSDTSKAIFTLDGGETWADLPGKVPAVSKARGSRLFSLDRGWVLGVDPQGLGDALYRLNP